jgi:sugar lactone lactonase YvrE
MEPNIRMQRLVVGLTLLVMSGSDIGPQATRVLRAEGITRRDLDERRNSLSEPDEELPIVAPDYAVLCVVFSSDGKALASGQDDTRIKLRDGRSGQTTAIIQGHEGRVNSVAFSPDGKTLASGSHDRTIKLWDVATGKQNITLAGHSGEVLSVVFSPDGKTLASASADNTIKLWEVATGRERVTVQGHTEGVRSVAFSPDGRMLATGSNDNTIKLWEVATGKEKVALQGHAGWVHSVAFSPDGRLVASGSADATIKVWDVATGKEKSTLRGHGQPVLSVTFSPDGKTLASGVYCVAFSPDGKTLASGNMDGRVKLWNVTAGPNTGEIKLWNIAAAERTDKETRIAQAARLSGKDLDDLWTTLAGEDAAKAYQAIGTLVGSSDQAVPLVKERLRPASQTNAQQIARWISELDSDQFVIRRKATEELEKVGEQAEAVLRKKLTERPSLEVRQRIDRLLTGLEPQNCAKSLRALRAVEVLEYIGTSEAKQVLETLATGAEGARLTREAKASIERLDKRMAANK